jgi:Collagen triple helix repeat (20 copies)
MNFSDPFIALAGLIIVAVIAYPVIDQYRLWRDRMVETWRKQGRLPIPPQSVESDTDGSGELSTAAKYAITNYMFRLLAVGGTLIGVIAGVAGYMIKDLATERAIQAALNKMQEPLTKQLEKFTDADAALKVATNRVNDSKTFPRAVADDLIVRYPAALRGPQGEKGEKGKDGIDGKSAVSPSAHEVAEDLLKNHLAELKPKDGSKGEAGAPGKDGRSPTADEVAAALLASPADVKKLRGTDGSNGKDGVNGKDGLPGKDGSNGKDGATGSAGLNGKDGRSPTAAEVSAVLLANSAFVAGLHGKDGTNGKDGVNGKDGAPGKDGHDGKDGPPGSAGINGADGKSPSPGDVAAVLAANPAFADSARGKDGRDGKDGVSPELAGIADMVFSKYHDRLQGAPGKDGASGRDGEAAKAADVAAALWASHRDELRANNRSRR